MVFHVLIRGVAGMKLFEKAADYEAFEQVLRDTLDQSPMLICAYAVMPNHWHLLLWPECDGELTAFMQRLTITHVRRWQEHSAAQGPQPNLTSRIATVRGCAQSRCHASTLRWSRL
jgi:putative transposase